MNKKVIEQSTLTASNNLSKTKITKEIIEKMVVALNDHRIDDIGEFFFNNFNWFGNYGCGTKLGFTQANTNFALNDPNIGGEYKNWLLSLLAAAYRMCM